MKARLGASIVYVSHVILQKTQIDSLRPLNKNAVTALDGKSWDLRQHFLGCEVTGRKLSLKPPIS